LESLCDHLTADRFNVLAAPTASDALRHCRYHDPDLMLLDMALPDASGLDVMREIRQADGATTRFDPQLPIIVVSGRTADTDRVRGLEEGADDYPSKPASYEELRG
jgi:two-component system phosphate regulon response regulator PhoB